MSTIVIGSSASSISQVLESCHKLHHGFFSRVKGVKAVRGVIPFMAITQLCVERSSENAGERPWLSPGEERQEVTPTPCWSALTPFPRWPSWTLIHSCEEGWENVSPSHRCPTPQRKAVGGDRGGSSPIPASSVYPEMLNVFSSECDSTPLALWKQFANRFSLHRLLHVEGQVRCLIVSFQQAAYCWLWKVQVWLPWWLLVMAVITPCASSSHASLSAEQHIMPG